MSIKISPIVRPETSHFFVMNHFAHGLLGLREFDLIDNGNSVGWFTTAAVRTGRFVDVMALTTLDSLLSSGVIDMTDHVESFTITVIWFYSEKDGYQSKLVTLDSTHDPRLGIRRVFVDHRDENTGRITAELDTQTGQFSATGSSALGDVVGVNIEIHRANANRQPRGESAWSVTNGQPEVFPGIIEVDAGNIAITDELVEIAQYEGVEMSRYTLAWKDLFGIGSVAPGTKLYVKRSDIQVSPRNTGEPVPFLDNLVDAPSTVMDKDRLDRAT